MRARDIVAVIVGLAFVAAVGVGGWWWLSDTLDPDEDPGSDLGATVDAYLDAWAAGDHIEMAVLVREPPEDFSRRHQQLRDGLEPTTMTLEAGDITEEVDGRATVPVTVTLELPVIADPVSWDIELRLLREGGEWGVEWSLSTIHPEMQPTWQFGTETENVERSPILAADGTELAGSGTRVTFGFQPAGVDDPQDVVDAFEEAFPGAGARAQREFDRGNLNPDWFYPVITVSEPRADEVSSTLRQANGILRQSSSGRTLLDDGFAAHVIGVVAEATAEQLEELGEPYEPGDEVGQYGLERLFEDSLIGSEVVRIGLREGDDGPLRVVIGEGQEDPSRPIETTIDVAVQRAVENALVGITDPAAIVVVDATSGAIVGSASRPLSGFNRAFEGRYPPGSTFKVVTAEALLAGGAGPDDEVACPGSTVVGGLQVPNAGGKDLGTTTLHTAFAESCNTSFATLGAALGAQALAEAAERFGFGVDPVVPLPAFGGSFPEPGDAAETAAASFGQARVEASPLHLAAVAAAANNGTWRQPYLLADDGPGETRALATGTLDPLRAFMRATVTEGTGTAAAVDGQDVFGKTGTAQGTGDVEHAWFIGSWDDLGFAILVEEGGAGSEVAAPIAARLVEELVGLTTGAVDPTEPSEGVPEDLPEDGGEPAGD